MGSCRASAIRGGSPCAVGRWGDACEWGRPRDGRRGWACRPPASHRPLSGLHRSAAARTTNGLDTLEPPPSAVTPAKPGAGGGEGERVVGPGEAGSVAGDRDRCQGRPLRRGHGHPHDRRSVGDDHPVVVAYPERQPLRHPGTSGAAPSNGSTSTSPSLPEPLLPLLDPLLLPQAVPSNRPAPPASTAGFDGAGGHPAEPILRPDANCERPRRRIVPVEPETVELEVVDSRSVAVPAAGSLLDVLRDHLGLRSAKDGCSPQGQCGCCTVLVDGAPRVACVTPARRVAGRSVTTLDGLPSPPIADRMGRGVPGHWGQPVRLLHSGNRHAARRRCGPRASTRPATTARGGGRAALAAHLCRCTALADDRRRLGRSHRRRAGAVPLRATRPRCRRTAGLDRGALGATSVGRRGAGSWRLRRRHRSGRCAGGGTRRGRRLGGRREPGRAQGARPASAKSGAPRWPDPPCSCPTRPWARSRRCAPVGSSLATSRPMRRPGASPAVSRRQPARQRRERSGGSRRSPSAAAGASSPGRPPRAPGAGTPGPGRTSVRRPEAPAARAAGLRADSTGVVRAVRTAGHGRVHSPAGRPASRSS